jgi:hypothetical protein
MQKRSSCRRKPEATECAPQKEQGGAPQCEQQ